jgi:hypothetical protein
MLDQISNAAVAINITKPMTLSMLPPQRIVTLRDSVGRIAGYRRLLGPVTEPIFLGRPRPQAYEDSAMSSLIS